MPSTRIRRSRVPAPEFSAELIAWARGEAPHPVEAYFLSEPERARLMRDYGRPGVEPRGPDAGTQVE